MGRQVQLVLQAHLEQQAQQARLEQEQQATLLLRLPQ